MLKDKDAMATVAVKDMSAGRKFYEGTLGFKLVHDEGGQALTFQSGSSKLIVYQSEFAGTNKATTVTWDVGGDVASIVADLKGKGVSFEHYHFPGMKLEGDVHVMGPMKAAWFKDPEGNILGIVGQ